MDLQIVFQNENFVVCDKSANMLSVPARDRQDSRPCLGLLLQQHLHQKIFPVHRLDYEVSGLILYALNVRSHAVSQEWFVKKNLQKKYDAITSTQDFSHWPESLPTERAPFDFETQKEFFWKTQILRGKRRSYESTQGDWAETKAQFFQKNKNQIYWSLQPLTGKPHQLRFELSRRGFPICGDQLYGSKMPWKYSGIALKAVEINLEGIQNRLGLPEKITLESLHHF